MAQLSGTGSRPMAPASRGGMTPASAAMTPPSGVALVPAHMESGEMMASPPLQTPCRFPHVQVVHPRVSSNPVSMTIVMVV